MPGLEVRGLVKRLGDHQAVDDLSFSVRDGEFLVLLGPSGCGKTTALRIICGLEQPDAGEVIIADRPVTSLPARDRNLGMVFQEYGLYPSMDVFGNLAYGLQARGNVAREEIDRRVRAAAGKLDLTDLLKAPITDLSGGEQQRVALGRALVKDADAYLFDEPLSNLDPKLRHRVRRDITALHREKGKPTVYVTHDQTEAFSMGDVVAVMANGRVQQVGPPDELVERPANTFVAGFVGSPPMNLLRARLRAVDGAYAAVVGEAVLPLPEAWTPALAGYDKEEVTLGVRPDAVTLAGPGGADTLAAEVIDIEPLIGEAVVRLRLKAQDAVVSAERAPVELGSAGPEAAGPAEGLAAVFRSGEEGGLAPGDVVRLGARPDGLRVFDRDSGQALLP
ncbi:ABC transporter ATP-binding protein [Actinopolymorpha alba]|uniref:ABC transporter ATP-binding protein n=1 Tax=Actinopolymorpha alba TaxID=533267 RepID=UPI000369DDA4|nr:ABC transporter ATP-binding protein [Actinopolymorpha alba]